MPPRPSPSSPRGVRKCPFPNLAYAMYFVFLCFLLVISLFEIVLKRGAEMLCRAPHGMQRIHVLDKLCSGLSDRALGCECRGDGSAIYIQ